MSRVFTQHRVQPIELGGVLVDPASYLGGAVRRTESIVPSGGVNSSGVINVDQQQLRSGSQSGQARKPRVSPCVSETLSSGSEASRPAFIGAALLLIFTMAMLVHAQVARANVKAPAVQRNTARQSVVARSGDSIWSIARSVQPTGDIRTLVDEIIAERDSPVVFVGDVVSVPVP